MTPCSVATSLPEDRRGRLRNHAPPGDFLAAPRCGARTRAGGCCRQPAMANGRCRMHGGLSTGPRTAEGRARCAAARRTHGFYGAETVALRRAGAAYSRRVSALLASLKVRRTAGHGVLRSNPSNRPAGKGQTLPGCTAEALRQTSSARNLLTPTMRPPLGMGSFRHFLHQRPLPPAASPLRRGAKASSSAPSSAPAPSASASPSPRLPPLGMGCLRHFSAAAVDAPAAAGHKAAPCRSGPTSSPS